MPVPNEDRIPPRAGVLKIFPFGLDWRYPMAIARIRFVAGGFNFLLGVLMCSYGIWLGLLPLLASPLIFWVGSLNLRISRAQRAASGASLQHSSGG